MRTTARRDGDSWVLNGAKRWIGNGTFADLVIVFARDVDDDQVKTFVVEKGTPGFTATKIEDKFALRTVQNADLTFTDCRIPAREQARGRQHLQGRQPGAQGDPRRGRLERRSAARSVPSRRPWPTPRSGSSSASRSAASS